MASDDDDEELAALRAQRAARLGTSGLTVSALRSKQREEEEGMYYAEPANKVRPSPLQQGARSAPDEGSDGEEEDRDDDDPGPVPLGMEEEVVLADGLRSQFPMAFGEQERQVIDLEAVHKATARTNGSNGAGAGADGSGSSGESDEEDDDGSDPHRLPVTHEVALEGQDKVVTALAVDRAGARVLAGSRDYSLRMFDFNGMNSTMRAFRTLQPADGHPVNALSWSPTGDAFLVVTGSSQMKVYDRDGVERGESVRGDMYIRDARNTKGHVSPCTSGQWHPTDRYTGMTASEDGSVRVWDLYNVLQKTVIKPKLVRPGRVSVTTCRYNSDGRLLVAGLRDGTLQLWDVKGKFGTSAAVGQVLPPKPQMMGKQDWTYVSGGGRLVQDAHAPDAEICSLAFSADDQTLLSRATDDTLKVWDLRQFKQPVETYAGLPALHAQTSVIFSPDETLLVTGVAAGRDGKGGAVVFIDRAQNQIVRRIAMPGSVIALVWHEQLNQIFVGTGDNKSGETRVLYDPTFSERGVLAVAARKPRVKNPFDFEAPLVIHTPHALPMYREDRPTKKHKPSGGAGRAGHGADAAGLISAKPGTGGRVGAPSSTLLTQFIMKNQGKLKNPADEDIRTAILRHQDEGQLKGFTDAYAKTQPNPIFAKDEEEEEEGS